MTPRTDPPDPPRRYAYDPHLDPQLVWAGKAERQSFEVPTVSLHVHERIDPRTIVEAVRRGPDPAAPASFRCSSSRRRTRAWPGRWSSTATRAAGPTAWWRVTPSW